MTSKPEPLVERLRFLAKDFDRAGMGLLAETLREAATRLEAEQWRPIEEAPRDGRHVLLSIASDPPAFVAEGYWEEDGDRGWYAANTHWTDYHDGSLTNVTAWMPLPKPQPPEERT